ncbi:MAG: ATP-binding cassette domain-containing protein, partial [Clostridiales bacterium]|nr:ATP-binding cassette domain-containing protein [Clostridiales bacterium]
TMAYLAEQSRRMQQRRKNLERRQQSAIDVKSGLLKNIESAVPLRLRPEAYHASRLLYLENVSVSYGDREVFRDLSFTLERGDRIVLLGGNGAGKSSILKLISGENIPYSGHVAVGSQLRISYVPQDASFLKGSLQAYAKRIGIDETLFMTNLRQMDFSRTQLEKDMDALSAGQKKKILIAASLSMQAHVYLWDEPLNYIDVLSRIQIEDLIASYQPTMLFTEHDQAFCDRLATKTVRIHAFIAG